MTIRFLRPRSGGSLISHQALSHNTALGFKAHHAASILRTCCRVVFGLLFACGAAAQTDGGPLQSKGVQSTAAVPPVSVRVGRSGMPLFRIAAPVPVLKGLQPKTATFTMQYLNH